MRRLIIATAAILLLAGQSLAAAPQPASRIDPERMTGRWFEIARLPNRMQRDCYAPTADWTRTGAGFDVVQTCRKGGATGRPVLYRAKAAISDLATYAKVRMSFFGGLVRQEYWILDRAPDQSWIIMGTPGGHALWLMARDARLSDPAKTRALQRIRELGYDAGALEFKGG